MRRKKAVFFGDSITQHGSNTSNHGWVARFTEWYNIVVIDDNSIMMIMVTMMILLMLLTMLSLFVCYYINES